MTTIGSPRGYGLGGAVTARVNRAALGVLVRGDRTNREDDNASMTHVANWHGSHELKGGSQGNWGSFTDFRL